TPSPPPNTRNASTKPPPSSKPSPSPNRASRKKTRKLDESPQIDPHCLRRSHGDHHSNHRRTLPPRSPRFLHPRHLLIQPKPSPKTSLSLPLSLSSSSSSSSSLRRPRYNQQSSLGGPYANHHPHRNRHRVPHHPRRRPELRQAQAEHQRPAPGRRRRT